mmetsp:Transcript_2641/g.2931  ORF Transcript_2641/g.2931 Transcript_2641/m.2931 type:complete len:404 (+) Transcript_2641:77-1288(+)
MRVLTFILLLRQFSAGHSPVSRQKCELHNLNFRVGQVPDVEHSPPVHKLEVVRLQLRRVLRPLVRRQPRLVQDVLAVPVHVLPARVRRAVALRVLEEEVPRVRVLRRPPVLLLHLRRVLVLLGDRAHVPAHVRQPPPPLLLVQLQRRVAELARLRRRRVHAVLLLRGLRHEVPEEDRRAGVPLHELPEERRLQQPVRPVLRVAPVAHVHVRLHARKVQPRVDQARQLAQRRRQHVPPAVQDRVLRDQRTPKRAVKRGRSPVCVLIAKLVCDVLDHVAVSSLDAHRVRLEEADDTCPCLLDVRYHAAEGVYVVVIEAKVDGPDHSGVQSKLLCSVQDIAAHLRCNLLLKVCLLLLHKCNTVFLESITESGFLKFIQLQLKYAKLLGYIKDGVEIRRHRRETMWH